MLTLKHQTSKSQCIGHIIAPLCSTPIPQINALLKRSNHLQANRHEHRNYLVYGLNMKRDSIGINACTVPQTEYSSFIDDSKSPNTDPYSQFPLNGDVSADKSKRTKLQPKQKLFRVVVTLLCHCFHPMSWIGNEPGALHYG